MAEHSKQETKSSSFNHIDVMNFQFHIICATIWRSPLNESSTEYMEYMYKASMHASHIMQFSKLILQGHNSFDMFEEHIVLFEKFLAHGQKV
jgi:hypothetical protein